MAKYKYPRLTILAVAFILAYIFLTGRELVWLRELMLSLGLFGAFLAGVLYGYGFTAPFASAALILISKEHAFMLVGIIAGIGTVVADLVIFSLIREEFLKEFRMLGEEPGISHLKSWLSRVVHIKIKHYTLPLIGAFFIASPLPDEIGVSMLALDRHISPAMFAVVSYALNTLGILTIVYVGSLL